MCAAEHGHSNIVDLLLVLQLMKEMRSSYISLPFMVYNLPVVRLCVQDPRVEDRANKECKTTLFLAIEGGDTEILRVLLHEEVMKKMMINIAHIDVNGCIY